MANEKHVKLLKQGSHAWNQWREEVYEIEREDETTESDGPYYASYPDADLVNADLSGLDLSHAELNRANLRGANLTRTNLCGANLSWAKFSMVKFGETVFGNTNLFRAEDLKSCNHFGPSTIDHRTILRSRDLPLVFLRGCGLPDELITFYKEGLNQHAQHYYSCFISYSSIDQKFVERLYSDLQKNGVRCWYAPEDLKIGDKIRDSIDKAIQNRDKLLLVLSKNSIKSDWVEKEVETVFEEERKKAQKEAVFVPIRLDDEIMKTELAWAADIRRTRNIGNFSNWNDPGAYQKALDRLLRDLISTN